MSLKVRDVCEWLSELLKISEVKDASQNGLQVGDMDAPVHKVACSVDACLDVFEQSQDAGADFLFVHHGLLWSRAIRLVGAMHKRLGFLMKNDMALYAAHLPLDMHPEVGNNIGLIEHLGLEDAQPFGDYHGLKIGFKGKFVEPQSMEQVIKRLGFPQEDFRQVRFHDRPIETVGIVSGDAPGEVNQAIAQGLDLYITGEPSHTIFHDCKEAGMNALFAGHYNTETFGARLVGQKMHKDLGLPWVFIESPTGL